MAEHKIKEGQPGILRAALFGCCPNCSAKTLFAGVVRFANSCSNCQLDFTQYNVGDGPAAFLTMIVGAVVIALAIMVDIAVRPPFWLHAMIWVPFTVILIVGLLRFAKGALIASEHRNQAGEVK